MGFITVNNGVKERNNVTKFRSNTDIAIWRVWHNAMQISLNGNGNFA